MLSVADGAGYDNLDRKLQSNLVNASSDYLGDAFVPTDQSLLEQLGCSEAQQVVVKSHAHCMSRSGTQQWQCKVISCSDA